MSKFSIFFTERTKQEKVAAENDLKVTLTKKELAMKEIQKEAAIIEQKRQEQEIEINKVRTVAEDKERVIKE